MSRNKHQALALVAACTLGMGAAFAEEEFRAVLTRPEALPSKPAASPLPKPEQAIRLAQNDVKATAKPAESKAPAPAKPGVKAQSVQAKAAVAITKPDTKSATAAKTAQAKPANSAATPVAKPAEAKPGTKPAAKTAIKKPAAKPNVKKAALPPGARLAKPGISDIVKTVGADGKPIWLDLPKGLSAARQSKKYMMVDLSTSWCGWCKRLDHDVFQNAEVEAFLAKNMVSVRLDAEDGGQGQALAQKYDVHGYPTVLFFTPTGGYHGRVEGYRPVDEYSRLLQQVAQGKPLPQF